MGFYFILYFLFIHFSLLITGYTVVRSANLLKKGSGLLLVVSYFVPLILLGLLSTAGYVFKLDLRLLQLITWLGLLGSSFVFMKKRMYREFSAFRFPLICLVLMSLLSCLFVSLSFPSKYTYFPDPEILSERNYDVFNVKVLNLAQTQANDNYVPYRQAQFIINRSDPGNDCFICEWGVGFFQRTPLMGAVTAGYFTLLNDKPPIDYLWSKSAADPSHTYLKFQIISQILNSLLILPAFYILTKMFKKRVAIISCAFLITSPFFLYNSVFSWPKSLVAFFVLAMWLLLLENKRRYTIIAGIAGGLAYLTHDLAMFYIASGALMLLYHRRYKDTLILSGISASLALPWMFISSFIYKKPSTFILYPFSLDGLPQPGNQEAIIKKFLHTSPLEIISIRFDTLFYLLTPYDLIYKLGNQDIFRRIWAVSLYSVPGSLGLGLVIPTILGAIKKIQKLDFWILVSVPILLSAAIVGWRGSRAIASLHFAQAIIVLLTGLSIAYLLSCKKMLWLWIVFALQLAQLVFYLAYSFPGITAEWVFKSSNAIILATMLSITLFSGILIRKTMKNKLPKWLFP